MGVQFIWICENGEHAQCLQLQRGGLSGWVRITFDIRSEEGGSKQLIAGWLVRAADRVEWEGVGS